MANEQTTGAPLTAPLAEQLREKAHLDEVRAAEREPDRIQAERVERGKAAEREAALRHAQARPGAGRDRGRAALESLRESAGHAKWPVLAAGLALFAGLYLFRRLARR